MRHRIYYCLPLLFMHSIFISAQQVSGIVKSKDNTPLPYVNIAVTQCSIGTVSGIDGKFDLLLEEKHNKDTLVFSCIGYETLQIKIADFKKQKDKFVFLAEKDQTLNNVTIKPKKVKEKTLGITTKSTLVTAGFLEQPDEKQKGDELGIIIKTKKKTHIKAVTMHIAYCPYDTFFYRLNIYKVKSNMEVENILPEPIYINFPKSELADGITIDLRSKYITVDADFLISLENINNLGNGNLSFCASFGSKTYYRRSFQSEWKTAPVGISISVLADVEE